MCELDKPITRTQFCVLLVLADIANEHDTCWPGYSTIAQRSRSSVATVRRSLDELSTLGIVEVKRGAGGRDANVYRLLRPRRSGPLAPFTDPAHGEHGHGDHAQDEQAARAPERQAARAQLDHGHGEQGAQDEQAARAPERQAARAPDEHLTLITPHEPPGAQLDFEAGYAADLLARLETM
jgi:hypothetical protein